MFHGTGSPDLNVEANKAFNVEHKKSFEEWSQWDKTERLKSTGEAYERGKLNVKSKRDALQGKVDELTKIKGSRIYSKDDIDLSSPEAFAESVYRRSAYDGKEKMWKLGVFEKYDDIISTSIKEEDLTGLRDLHAEWQSAEGSRSSINPKPRGPRVLKLNLKTESPVFDTHRYGANDEGYLSAGSYFTDDAEMASGFASTTKTGKGGVLPVYLNLRNPYVHGVTNQPGVEDLINLRIEEARQVVRSSGGDVDEYSRAAATGRRSALIEAGFDGEIRRVEDAGATSAFQKNEYVVFDDTNIKSTFNRGTWDESGNILFQGDELRRDVAPAFYSKLSRVID